MLVPNTLESRWRMSLSSREGSGQSCWDWCICISIFTVLLPITDWIFLLWALSFLWEHLSHSFSLGCLSSHTTSRTQSVIPRRPSVKLVSQFAGSNRKSKPPQLMEVSLLEWSLGGSTFKWSTIYSLVCLLPGIPTSPPLWGESVKNTGLSMHTILGFGRICSVHSSTCTRLALVRTGIWNRWVEEINFILQCYYMAGVFQRELIRDKIRTTYEKSSNIIRNSSWELIMIWSYSNAWLPSKGISIL